MRQQSDWIRVQFPLIAHFKKILSTVPVAADVRKMILNLTFKDKTTYDERADQPAKNCMSSVHQRLWLFPGLV